MTSNTIPRPLLPFMALAVFAIPACNGIGPFDGEDGSGVPEITSFETGEFDEITVTGVFDVTLTVEDGPPSVVVTVDDNFVDDLDVGVRGDRLEIGFRRGSYDPDVQPTAVVTVASLSDVDVSGASSLIVNDLDGEKLSIEASGASIFTASGAATAISVEASGASHVDLSDFDTTSANVNASGASSVELGRADRVSGDLSGASHLSAPSGTAGSVSTSGGAFVERS